MIVLMMIILMIMLLIALCLFLIALCLLQKSQIAYINQGKAIKIVYNQTNWKDLRHVLDHQGRNIFSPFRWTFNQMFPELKGLNNKNKQCANQEGMNHGKQKTKTNHNK